MSASAFNLLKSGIIASSRPAVSSFTETGVSTNNSGWFMLPSTLPDTEHFMVLMSFEMNADDRGNMVAFDDTTASQGFKPNNGNGTGFINPRCDWPSDGFSPSTYSSTQNYAVGDRMNILLSGSVVGGIGNTRAVVWDETSGSATTDYTHTSPSGAVDYPFTSNFTTVGQSFFASANGGRVVNCTNYRLAWWDLSSAPPDITAGSVQDNFFNSSTGSIVDPATGNALYGTPLYDIYGPLSNYTGGLNQGSGSNFTVNGTFVAA